jgi:type IV fimbrial biogenesis protein FimT
LVELVTVIAMVGVLMAIGVPSYRYVTNSNRMSSEVNGLLGDLQYARAEAIKEGSPVTVCVSTDGISCSTTNNWESGWLVFSDFNGSATRTTNEPILRVQATFNNGDTFKASGTPPLTAVTFNREGFAAGLPGTVTVTLQDKTATSAWTRSLCITLVGALTTKPSGQVCP